MEKTTEKMPVLNRIDIIELIREEGLAADDEIKKVAELSSQNRKSVVENIVSMGVVSQRRFAEVLAARMDIEYAALSAFSIHPDAAASIPENLAREHTVLPVLKVGGLLTVSMYNPFDMEAIEAIEYYSKCRVRIVISTFSEIQEAIERVFGVYGKIAELLKEIDESSLNREEIPRNKEYDAGEEADIHTAGPISQIINLLIKQAVNIGGSDIHVEPSDKMLRVRMRVDGLLQEVLSLKKIYQSTITASIKIMSQMDIAEKRVPQDGRFRIRIGERAIDLRVSSFPASYGEKIVLRILDKSSMRIELEHIGFDPSVLTRLKTIIVKPYGIFLVTGPTGSGKTTTLYAILTRINDIQKNIITLEDPIEYDLENINQAQINTKAGLTFANGLRSILRQDPDIIMVGEIRDMETAEIATQSALTGHLVLSTLHTNDAPSAANRLIDMGVEPFLVASSIEGVLSQRLVRRICPKCKEPYTPSKDIAVKFNLADNESVFYRAKGCRQCGRTGYKGRTGIYELMMMTDELRSIIAAKRSTSELKKAAIETGMKTLQQDGIRKALEGITTLEEVMRVAGGEE